MNSSALIIETRSEQDATVVALRGSAGMTEAEILQATFDELLATGRGSVVVDLSGLEFLSSNGLGVLIRAHQALRDRGGRLSLAAARQPVDRLLSITRIRDLIPVHKNVSDAVTAFGAGSA